MKSWDDPETAARILRAYRVFAVVGCSSRAGRPSNNVSRYLLDHGYDVIPVNPNETAVHGLLAYPDIASVPRAAEVVDIFRRSELAGAHVDEAIEAGAKAVWMQQGVIDEAAAERARAAGLDVVMDRCAAIEHSRLTGA